MFTKKDIFKEIASNCVNDFYIKLPKISNLEEIRETLKYSSFAMMKEKGKEEYVPVEENLDKILDIKLENIPVFEEEDSNIYHNDIIVFALSEKENEKLAKEIYSILEKDNERFETEMANQEKSNPSFSLKKVTNQLKQKELLVENIEKTFENTKPFEINDKTLEKASDLSFAINTIRSISNLFSFNDEVETKLEGNITQKNGKREFNLKLFDDNNEKVFKTNSLTSLKNELIDFAKEKNNNEDYSKEEIENINSILDDFKDKNFDNIEINLEKDFKFDFNKKNLLNQCSLKIDYEKTCVETFSKLNSNFDKLTFTLTNNGVEKAFLDINDENIITKKDEYLKEENKELSIRLDDFIKNEKLENTNLGIFHYSIAKTNHFIEENIINGNDDNYTLNDYKVKLKENFEEVFETRIGKLKDKESFLVQNSKELRLTLTPENKISEFNSAIEEEYKENIETYINVQKENLFTNLVGGLEKLEKRFAVNINTDNEEKKEKTQKENYKIALESSKSSLRLNNFYPMTEKAIENSMILEISENDIKDKTIKKNKLFKKVKQQSKNFSENVSLNEKIFDDIFENIDFTKYEKLSTNKIEFQVEISKNKETEKEISNEKEIDL